jgi:hypothetical protein
VRAKDRESEKGNVSDKGWRKRVRVIKYRKSQKGKGKALKIKGLPLAGPARPRPNHTERSEGTKI